MVVSDHVSETGSYLPPELTLPPMSAPPQTIMRLPVHTAEKLFLAVGAPVVEVAIQVSVDGLYLPPELSLPDPPVPPQIIICEPVHKAALLYLAAGAPEVSVAAQLSVHGLYLPPVFRYMPSSPPHTIIRVPVHTAM